MTKSNYTAMVISQVGFELENVVLRGSVTTVPLKINQVIVDDYDPGFTGGDDFMEISFD